MHLRVSLSSPSSSVHAGTGRRVDGPEGAVPCALTRGRCLADRMLPPRKHGVLIPGPQSHAFKLAFERYFLWKNEHGYVGLP